MPAGMFTACPRMIVDMTVQSPLQPYPGESATAEELFLLAEEYRRASDLLVAIRRPGRPLSRAPYHQVAIHAIELYLNALLLFEGMSPGQLRGLQHNLSARVGHELASGLALRGKTIAHLAALSERREYLISRYGTDQMNNISQINRLQATLEEVRAKVAKRTGRTLSPSTSMTKTEQSHA